MWGHGIVQFSQRERVGPAERGSHSQAQLAAYLAKGLAGYVAKELAAGRGRHAYDVGQGFQPQIEDLLGESDKGLRDLFVQRFGGELWRTKWRSEDDEGWRGPLVRCWVWSVG
jgi:hypothetical protein